MMIAFILMVFNFPGYIFFSQICTNTFNSRPFLRCVLNIYDPRLYLWTCLQKTYAISIKNGKRL